MEFGQLCGGEVFFVGFEISVGIDYFWIQLELVEVVGQVVVVMDGFGVCVFVVVFVNWWCVVIGFVECFVEGIVDIDDLVDWFFDVEMFFDVGFVQCIEVGMGDFGQQ